MSYFATVAGADSPVPEAREELRYPAEFHFSVIVEAASAGEVDVARVLGAYRVTRPLADASRSAAGRYRAWRVSVELGSRSEHASLDRALRQVPGVRMVL
jgi:putative lipoic acid-binding regulatory protein